MILATGSESEGDNKKRSEALVEAQEKKVPWLFARSRFAFWQGEHVTRMPIRRARLFGVSNCRFRHLRLPVPTCRLLLRPVFCDKNLRYQASKKSKSRNAAGDGDSDPKVVAKPARPKRKDTKKDKEPESLLNQNQDAVLPIPSVPVQAGRRISAKRIEDILMFTLEANTYLHTIQAERGVRYGPQETASEASPFVAAAFDVPELRTISLFSLHLRQKSTCYVARKGKQLQELLVKVRKDTDEAAKKLKEVGLLLLSLFVAAACWPPCPPLRPLSLIRLRLSTVRYLR